MEVITTNMEINKNREDFEKREAMESEKTTHQQLPEKSSETVSKADPAETKRRLRSQA